ncbi:uncharacterized protein FIBRA_04717 [Fibroporia radiculosa]|uniref:Uncharacterized protein n=1 Tax=Fibroporia radiculosa TaxID=599839 RepID=J4H341_9APHY|nr:uncharacterized protein FIBRA_04717 [Fibroporia radiculosa]CCM02614.1 predicted protein [Fibroporia radiculosa]
MFQHSPEPLPLPHDDHLFMSKLSTPGPLYFQQRTQVIQLTEVPAPPRAQHPFTLSASSLASSSYTSSSDESAEEDSDCSSYCSSAPEETPEPRSPDDTYKTRLHRILVWREKLAVSTGTPLAPPPTLPTSATLKRKTLDDDSESDDDAVSVPPPTLSPRLSFLTIHYVGVSFLKAVAVELEPKCLSITDTPDG